MGIPIWMLEREKKKRSWGVRGEGIGLDRKREKLVAFSSSVNYSWPAGLKGVYRHGNRLPITTATACQKFYWVEGGGKLEGDWSACVCARWMCVCKEGGGGSFLMAFHHITFCQDWKCLHSEWYWHNYDENSVEVENENITFFPPQQHPTRHCVHYIVGRI